MTLEAGGRGRRDAVRERVSLNGVSVSRNREGFARNREEVEKGDVVEDQVWKGSGSSVSCLSDWESALALELSVSDEG